MTTIRDFTLAELEVLDTLGKAWGQFCALPPAHPEHIDEFRLSLHRLQDIVLTRPALEIYGWKHGGTES